MGGSCVRSYLSKEHWENAVILRNKSQEIELGQVESKYCLVEHRAFVYGTIYSATAFLESFINEIILDTAEGHHQFLKSLGNTTLDTISQMAQAVQKGENMNVLIKYSRCIIYKKKRNSFRNSTVWDNAQSLIYLRNNLVHYRPEWRSGLEDLKKQNERSINGHEYIGKFPFSSRCSEDTINPIFPEKIVSYGCAKWAVDTCSDFVDAFCDLIGIEHLYKIQRGGQIIVVV